MNNDTEGIENNSNRNSDPNKAKREQDEKKQNAQEDRDKYSQKTGSLFNQQKGTNSASTSREPRRAPSFNMGQGQPNQQGRTNNSQASSPNRLLQMKKRRFFMSLSTFSTILMIIFSFTSLYFIFKDKTNNFNFSNFSKSLAKEEEYSEQKVEELAKTFNRLTPKDCMSAKYFSLEHIFDEYVQSIIPIIMKDSNTNYFLAPELRNIFLYGMPGTGKSFFAKKLLFMLAINIKAQELKKRAAIGDFTVEQIIKNETLLKELYKCNNTIEIYAVKPADFFRKHVGETEQITRSFFKFLSFRQKKIPILVFVDEAEALLIKRKDDTSGGSGVANNVVTEWLNWLQGIESREKERIFVIIATNYKSRIDPALWRRFGVHIGLPLPGKQERKEYFKEYCIPYIIKEFTSNKNSNANEILKEETALNYLVDLSEGISMSSLNEITNSVKSYVMNERSLMPIEALIEDIKNHKKIAEERKELEKDRKIDPTENPLSLEVKGLEKTDFSRRRDESLLIISKSDLDKLEMQVGQKQREALKKRQLENVIFRHCKALVDTRVDEITNPKRYVKSRNGADDAIMKKATIIEDPSKLGWGDWFKHYAASTVGYFYV